MKRNTHRIIAGTVLWIVLVFAITAAASAIEWSGQCGANITFEMNSDDVIVLTGYGPMDDFSENNSPFSKSTIVYKTKAIKGLIFENGITHIGTYSFSGASNLATIQFPADLKSIGKGAFSGCESLQSIALPNGTTYIGKDAFYNCYKLETALFSPNLETIGPNAFESCIILKKADLPASLKELGENAFYQCVQLQEVSVPEGITSLARGVFQKCYRVTKMTLPSTLTTIGQRALSEIKLLESLTIPDHVVTIADWAFAGNEALNNLVIPDSVTEIGQYAFSKCTGMTNITLSGSITKIPRSLFEGCTALGSIEIPEGVKSIDFLAFDGCSSLKEITIPNSVTSIPYETFRNCNNLTDVHYKGTEEEAAKLIRTLMDQTLKNATWHYEPQLVDLSAAEITVEGQVYTGKAIKPKLTVKVDGTELTPDTDYTVEYKNNKKVGVATVTVTGTGNYTGMAQATFKINPAEVKSPSVTAGKKKLTVKWKYDKKNDYDGYEIEYSLKKNFKNAKTVTIKKPKTTSTVIKSLKKGKTYYVRIRTWRKVSGKKYYSTWSKVMKRKVK